MSSITSAKHSKLDRFTKTLAGFDRLFENDSSESVSNKLDTLHTIGARFLQSYCDEISFDPEKQRQIDKDSASAAYSLAESLVQPGDKAFMTLRKHRLCRLITSMLNHEVFNYFAKSGPRSNAAELQMGRDVCEFFRKHDIPIVASHSAVSGPSLINRVVSSYLGLVRAKSKIPLNSEHIWNPVRREKKRLIRDFDKAFKLGNTGPGHGLRASWSSGRLVLLELP